MGRSAYLVRKRAFSAVGLCVSECPVEAITLEEKKGMEAPPADLDEVLQRLASERGVG